jgi:hypothetical protein
MTTYCFRLRFRMVTGLQIPEQPSTLAVPPLLSAAQISSSQPRTPGVDQWIAIKSCDYATQEEAEATARRLKDALLIAGAKGLGADFGVNRVRSSLSDDTKRDIKEKYGTVIRDEVHGIDVFESGDVRHFEFSAQGIVHMDLSSFEQHVVEVSDLPELTSITRTGAELINDSLFPMPDDARFLLRVSAVEALCEQVSVRSQFKT